MNESKRSVKSANKKSRLDIEKDHSERMLYQEYDAPNSHGQEFGVFVFPSLFPQFPLLDLDSLAHQRDTIYKIHQDGDAPIDFNESEYGELEGKLKPIKTIPHIATKFKAQQLKSKKKIKGFR